MTHIGITMGDSSGVGPEILLKAAHENSIPVPYVVYGDLAPLTKLNEQFQLPLHPIAHPSEARDGVVNIIDAHLLTEADLTPGKINAKSGHAARVIDDEQPGGVLVMGGDTVFALWRALGITDIQPLPERLPGIAASYSPHRRILFVTKAGGFGDDTLVEQIVNQP